jgi:hypothetical protein
MLRRIAYLLVQLAVFCLVSAFLVASLSCYVSGVDSCGWIGKHTPMFVAKSSANLSISVFVNAFPVLCYCWLAYYAQMRSHLPRLVHWSVDKLQKAPPNKVVLLFVAVHTASLVWIVLRTIDNGEYRFWRSAWSVVAGVLFFLSFWVWTGVTLYTVLVMYLSIAVLGVEAKAMDWELRVLFRAASKFAGSGDRDKWRVALQRYRLLYVPVEVLRVIAQEEAYRERKVRLELKEVPRPRRLPAPLGICAGDVGSFTRRLYLLQRHLRSSSDTFRAILGVCVVAMVCSVLWLLYLAITRQYIASWIWAITSTQVVLFLMLTYCAANVHFVVQQKLWRLSMFQELIPTITSSSSSSSSATAAAPLRPPPPPVLHSAQEAEDDDDDENAVLERFSRAKQQAMGRPLSAERINAMLQQFRMLNPAFTILRVPVTMQRFQGLMYSLGVAILLSIQQEIVRTTTGE